MYIVEDFAHDHEDFSCRSRPLIWESGDFDEHRHSDDDWCDCKVAERRHRYSDDKRKSKQTHDYYLHDWDDHMHKHDCHDWDDHMHKQVHFHHDWDNDMHEHYLHGRGEHMHKHEHCCSRRDNCKGCACEKLRDLARNTPVLFSTGDAPQLLTGLFISHDRETCSVTLRIGTADAYVACRDIKVLVIA